MLSCKILREKAVDPDGGFLRVKEVTASSTVNVNHCAIAKSIVTTPLEISSVSTFSE